MFPFMKNVNSCEIITLDAQKPTLFVRKYVCLLNRLDLFKILTLYKVEVGFFKEVGLYFNPHFNLKVCSFFLALKSQM